MKFLVFKDASEMGLAVSDGDGGYRGLPASDKDYPGDLYTLIGCGREAIDRAAGVLLSGRPVDPARVTVLPPISRPGKILCIGLNYYDHSIEAGFEVPEYPTVFSRFASSLIGHDASLVLPDVSCQLDFEGELAVVIGRGGRHIRTEDALDHVAGYSIFNDGSVRDFQMLSPQWTMGKNFDGTGAFGPVLVTPEALPSGARGLRLETRLNGATVQSASTTEMIFDVATLISTVSVVLTLSPGDVIVTGTPSGVGFARKPPLFLKPGDVCEVEIEGIGVLRNPVGRENAGGRPATQALADAGGLAG